MKPRYLFPNSFKKIGWIILVPAAILGIVMSLYDYDLINLESTVFAIYYGHLFEPSKTFTVIENNIADEILAILVIIGGLMAAFSEEKDEDEYIAKIRLESLLWATYINYGFLLFSVLFIYGLGFLQILIFNMFLLLFIFLMRFNFVLYKNTRILA